MPDLINTVFSPGSYIPHGHCYLWQTPLVWLHILSDGLIAFAYYSIPIVLIYLVLKRKDLPYPWVFGLFGAFIISCGTTHWLEIVTLWYPVYWLTGMTKAVTALVSLWTTLTLVPLLPEILAIPSPDQLREANYRLKQEIEERKAIELALRESEARLKEAQEIAHIGSWEFDITNQTMYWSDELYRIHGMEPRDYPLPIAQFELMIHPEDHWLHQSLAGTGDLTGELWEANLRTFHQTGEIRYLNVRGKPIRDHQGHLLKAVGTALDITEQKRAAAEQQKLNRLKDDFISTVSHELRTPLTSIKMSIHMLELVLNQIQPFLEEPPPHPSKTSPPNPVHRVKQYLDILRNQCEQELSLVNNLLELQRLESESVLLDTEKIDLADWLTQTILPYYERARSQQQEIQVKLAPDLPCVKSNRKILTRVLNELLTNACKHTPSSGVITVQVEAEAEVVYLKVQNSGVEIPAEELEHVFDRFYRIPSNDPWNQGGTGLGLALVEQQINYLGGYIEVSSAANTVQFVIQLPLTPESSTLKHRPSEMLP